jgi:hypothetical protein
MAELKERLERLADLGAPRGAETVWERAQDAFVVRPTTARRRLGRRRRRSTVIALSLVVALVAGLIYLTAGSDHGTVVSVAPGRPTDSLVLIDNGTGPLTLVDTATGASQFVTLPGKVGGDFTYDVIATGGYFVYQSARGVLAVPTSLNRAAHLVGEANVFIPSSRPGRVWLFTTPIGGSPTQGQEVGVDGRYRSPRYRLPFAGAATVAVNGGLIRGDTVWSSATNTTRVLPASRSGAPNVFDAHGSLVAWGGVNCQAVLPGCSSLEVLNLADNTQHAYPAPAGTAGWIPTVGEGSHDAFAPDGQHLAMRVALPPTPLLGGDPAPVSSQVYVLNLATGTSTLVPNSQARAYSPVAWTPDGRSVLFETDTHTLGLYPLGDATRPTLSQPCCGSLITASK